MDYRFSLCATANDLPGNWDELADCYFQTKEFFAYTERYNPCNQRYYLLFEANQLKAGACVYSLTINLLTFIKVKSPIEMQVIGIPATISPPGIIGEPRRMRVLLEHIFKEERSLILGMNLSPQFDCGSAVVMRSMPTIQLHTCFTNWQEYKDALRTNYRHKLIKISAMFKDVETRKGNCSRFDQAYYDLYVQILKRTNTPLETLSLEFFKNLPDGFLLTSYHCNEEILAWHITKPDRHVLYFFFGGTNYDLNERFSAYFNNLQGIVKEAISKGFSLVELGQTAEIPKTRLGGVPVELSLFLFHRNRAVNIFLKLIRNALKYRRKIPVAHVFKSPLPINKTN